MTSSEQVLVAALETSTRQPSVALGRFDLGHWRSHPELPALKWSQRCQSRLDGERPHAGDLLPQLEQLLQQVGNSPQQLDLILVGLGPGSYTGLRVGIATALGLARGTCAKLLGVPSTEVLAYGELQPGQTGNILWDARQGELYRARYELNNAADLAELEAPHLETREDFEAKLAQRVAHNEIWFVDAGTENWQTALQEATGTVKAQAVPTAAHLLELGSLRALEQWDELQPPATGANHTALEPLYLKPFRAKPRKR